MARTHDPARKYAPVWAILFASGAALAKTIGTTYILKRTWRFEWSDAATALGGAVFGYLAFRARHGNRDDGHWYTR